MNSFLGLSETSIGSLGGSVNLWNEESKLLYRKPLIIGKSLDNPEKGKVGCGACIRYSLMPEASVDWPTLCALGENFFSAAHIIWQSHCQTHIQGLNYIQ